MIFNSKKEINDFINTLIFIGSGIQGKCYVDRNFKNVYKFYSSFLTFDKFLYSEDEILKFKNIESSAFIFPKDTIKLNGQVIGDITSYKRAINLDKLNPLDINLNRLIDLMVIAIKEIEYISRKNVSCFDMMYNMLLGKKLYFIDTLDYSLSDQDSNIILKENMKWFNLTIMYFLIDGLFDNIVNSCSLLRKMYETNGLEISIIDFVINLKKYLSKILGRDVICLRDAKNLRDINVDEYNLKYDREDMIKERIINFKK